MVYLHPLCNLYGYFGTQVGKGNVKNQVLLVIVSIALLLDNMLYMVIIPIMPTYLRSIHAHAEADVTFITNGTANLSDFDSLTSYQTGYRHEDELLGYLFASKAIVQLIASPFSGALIDRVGYKIPFVAGLCVIFGSTILFAVGESYAVLLFARSVQGLGSAMADPAGLSIIADVFTEKEERDKALGIAIAFIAFGCVAAPPFGGIMYEIAGKLAPFLVLAAICLIDAVAGVVAIPKRSSKRDMNANPLKPTPIWRLLMDPYILICAGALMTANIQMAMVEPTLGKWMIDEMPGTTEFQIGVVFLPTFITHAAGVYATVVLMRRYPRYSWAITVAGLVIEGVASLLLPLCEVYWSVIFPLSLMAMGIALVDTAILPVMSYLVDTRHVAIYGTVFAIADFSYSIAYAGGPFLAGHIVALTSFATLNVVIFCSKVVYAPLLVFIRTFDFTDSSVHKKLSLDGSQVYGTLSH